MDSPFNTFYLETSSLRRLSSYLKLEKIKLFCFTSSLALIELLSGITENNFITRRNIISNILASRIKIDWAFPEEIISSGFPVLKGEETRLLSLKYLLEIILISTEYQEFIELCTKNNIRYDYNYFKKFDIFGSKRFIESTIEGNIKIKECLEESNPIDLKISEDDSDNIKEDFWKVFKAKYNNINISATLLSLSRGYAQKIVDRCEGLNISDVEHDLYNSYNGKIDYYIEAFSFYSLEKISKYEQPARNDFQDLAHFLYLRNIINVAMVSDDKLIENICNTLWQNKHITSNNFINIIVNR